MAELMPTITHLPVAEIGSEEGRIRPVSEASIAALMRVIGDHGFTSPIIVRRKRDGFSLIDGAHRLEAMRRLGGDDIPVRVYRCTDDEARAMESGQNLAGAPMSPLDDALFLSAYQEAYLKMHPETLQGVAGAFVRHHAKEIISFAKVVAEKRGVTVRRVRQIVSVGRELKPEDVALLRNAPRKLAMNDLYQIAKSTSDEERGFVVRALASGEVKNALAARKAYWAKVNGAVPRVTDPVEVEFTELLGRFRRARKAARRRFVRAAHKELRALLSDLDEELAHDFE